jgi:tetratricopeptide (TPR) repeat protein
MPIRVSGGALDFKTWSLRLLIFALVLACYWPALHGGILWDDPAHITRQDLRSWGGLVRIWTDMRATQQYYPVLFSAFWIEHRLWGDNTLGYHLTNVVLHATSCCLLAALLRRLWSIPPKTRIPAGTEWFAAALFAVHPVCVESVAWITEQKNTLSLVFYLLAGWAYLDFAEERRRQSYVLASILFLLAIGSKTVTVTLPAALLVVLWWKQGKLSWRRDVVPLIPWLVTAAGMGTFVSWFERKWIGAEGVGFDFSFPERALLAGRIFWFYLSKLLWPADLVFYYPRWDVSAEAKWWVGWTMALVGMTALLWVTRNRARGLLAGWLLYLGGLAPFLGFFNAFYFNFSFVADHSQYLAATSLVAVFVGTFGVLLSATTPRLRWAAAAVSGVLITVLAVLSNRQAALYRDNETLFRANVARNPSAWMAHQNLAISLTRTPDRHVEAMAEYREVLRLKPDHPEAHFGLGVELARIPGRRAEAIAEFERAIELRPIYAEAHNGLGLELARERGHEAEAIAHFEAALRVKPQLAEIHANLADILVKFPERLPEAMAQYAEALHLSPRLAWVHCHYAFQLAQLPGRQDEALAHYQEALRIQPDSTDAHNGLAIAYIVMGRPADARREWETVLKIDPTQEAVRRNLRRLDELEGR